ncbi:MAG TPA: LUD domain-containing protein, partial [Candidatus Dormibacteraeota bacterium]|nr:LUD domain-containing protein [Candidatus Dormibacteraeota bacterium]
MSEAGDRAAFLGRVRGRLAGGIPENMIRPIKPVGAEVGEIQYSVDVSDRVEAFTRALEAVAGKVVWVKDAAGLASTLHSLCVEHSVQRAVVSADPECEGIVDVLVKIGVVAEPLRNPAQAAEAELGVTGALWGVALTGSVVVDSARAGGRTASLLPPVHLALLPADRIVGTPGDVLRALGSGALP